MQSFLQARIVKIIDLKWTNKRYKIKNPNERDAYQEKQVNLETISEKVTSVEGSSTSASYILIHKIFD